MCFSPQRRALFRHLNFQKWSEADVFCTFHLEMCLAPQRRAIFHLIWPAGAAPAALASLLFDPPEPQIIGKTWKNTVFRDFPTFSRICIFFLLTLFSSLIFSLLIFLFSLPLPCSAFHLSILSEVWLLNFLRQFIFETLGIVTHYISIHLVGRSWSSLSHVHNGLCLWCVQLRKIETHSKGKQHKQHVHIIWSPPFGIPAVPLPGRAIVEAALDGLPETSRWRVTHWRHERLRREKHARWFYSNFNLDEAFKN